MEEKNILKALKDATKLLLTGSSSLAKIKKESGDYLTFYFEADTFGEYMEAYLWPTGAISFAMHSFKADEELAKAFDFYHKQDQTSSDRLAALKAERAKITAAIEEIEKGGAR